MEESIERRIAQLGKREESWVNRRDAAEELGRTATKSVEALRAHVEDEHTDVRAMVVKALGWAKAGLEGVQPVAQERAYTLDELARSVEKPGGREVSPKGDGFEIVVTSRAARSKRTSAAHATAHAAKDTSRLSTLCGPASDKVFRWALRNNTGLSHCALALSEEGGEEILVMVNSFLADAVTPAEFKSSVKELAYYGDWVESKLTDGDVF